MEKLAKQLTFKYAILQSTYWISQCSIFSFAAVYLQYKNFDNTQVGMVLSLAAVFSILLQPFIAAFADKTKKISLRHIVIALMFVVLSLAMILFIMPDSFFLIAGTYILINAIQFTLNPLFNSLALEYLNKGIPMNYGLARGTGSIAFAITSFIVGMFVNKFGPNILLIVFIISYLLVILSAFYFKLRIPKKLLSSTEIQNYVGSTQINTGVANALNSETVDNNDDKHNHNKNNNHDYCDNEITPTAPTGILTFFIKYKKFSFLLIGLVLIWYSHNVINTYLINIIKNVGGDSADLGISLSVAAALELPTMAAFIYLVRKIKCSTLLKISAFFFLVKAGVAWIAPNVLTVHISQAFQMLSFALYTPASIYYVNSIVDDNDKVKGQSMLGVASMGIAGTIANITGGRILDSLGVSHMLLIATIITAFGFVLVCFFTENTESTI